MESLPKEEESPAGEATKTGDGSTSLTDTAMDETSSTVVMIAQSKVLFDRLEMEAKVSLGYFVIEVFSQSCILVWVVVKCLTS